MRRFFTGIFSLTALLFSVILQVACGGGTPTANVVDKITFSTDSVSLNQGDVFQLSATATDKNGNSAIAALTYTSSNTDVVTVSDNGLLCAGKWDSKFIDCTPTTNTGTATVTVTSNNGKSATAKIFVHFKVDIVLANGPSDCLSAKDTTQLTATAKSSNPAVCSRLPGSPAPPCTLPSDTLGQVAWVTSDSDVVTIDNTAEKSGLATAGTPGTTTIFASVSQNNSPAVTFTTCPVVSLNITAGSTTDPFSVDKNGTRSLAAVPVDSKGKTLDVLPLIWTSTQPFAMSVAAGTGGITATATGTNPGTSVLMASCSAPECNRGLKPVYSNLISGTTNGSSNDTLYAASRDSVSLVPIDLANNNTVGTAVTLPQKPNSMIANRTATKIALGADSVTAMMFDTNASTVTSLNTPGVMLSFSPNGTFVGFAATVSTFSNVAILNSGTLISSALLPYTGNGFNLDLAFSPDSHFAFLTQESTKLQQWNASNQVQTVTLNSAANDVDFLAQGPAAYFVGGTANQVTARATCDPFTQVDTQSVSNAVFVRSVPNGSGVLALDPPNMVVLAPVTVTNPSSSSSCPPVVNSVRNSYPTGIVVPDKSKAQMLMTPDSTKAVITNGSNLIYIFDVIQHTTKPVTLSGAANLESYEADITLDSRFAYIGASDGKVHKIDLVAGSDSGQIDPGLKKDDKTTVANPHFVQLKHKQ